MRAFAARGKTVLFATHYLEEADAYADRAVLMARGRVVVDGPTTEIKARVGTRTIRATLPAADLALSPTFPECRRPRGMARQLFFAASIPTLRSGRSSTGSPAARDIEISGAGFEEAFLELTRDDDQEEAA